jgi:hypothetical protein
LHIQYIFITFAPLIQNLLGMKKIFTFILLSVVAIATSALPHSSLPLLTPAASDNTPAQEAVAQAMMQFKRDVTKHALRPMQAEKKQAKAKQDTIILNSDCFLIGPEYEAETSEWYIALESQDQGMCIWKSTHATPTVWLYTSSMTALAQV